MSECDSAECNFVKETYYQRNRDVILNVAKDYYKNDEERSKTYLKKKKRKRKNTEKQIP